MTQVDWFPVFTEVFGPQCIEKSAPPQDIRFENDDSISANNLTGIWRVIEPNGNERGEGDGEGIGVFGGAAKELIEVLRKQKNSKDWREALARQIIAELKAEAEAQARAEASNCWGFRFMQECLVKGMNYEQARAAFLADKADYVIPISESTLKYAWKNAVRFKPLTAPKKLNDGEPAPEVTPREKTKVSLAASRAAPALKLAAEEEEEEEKTFPEEITQTTRSQLTALPDGKTSLEPNCDQLEIFIQAAFRHCDPEGVVSVRSFHQEDSSKSFGIRPVPLKDGLKPLVKAAVKEARRAANNPQPIAFTPPVATFKAEAGWQAREEDLLEGPVLSVELDETPRAALAKLEALLGPATLVVRSGGQWTNPTTGEVEDKLHAYWRLKEPARDEDLHKLKELRRLAANLVGADRSNIPINHPIRWPGSWHRKSTPRLCEIVSSTEQLDNELDLDVALAALEAVSDLPPQLLGNNGKLPPPPIDGEIQVSPEFADLPRESLAEGLPDKKWFDLLSPEQKDAALDHGLSCIASNSKLLQLKAYGGHGYDNWFSITASVARSGAPHAADSFVKYASTATSPDPEDTLRQKFRDCQKNPRAGGITIGTFIRVARECGANFEPYQSTIGASEQADGGKQKSSTSKPKAADVLIELAKRAKELFHAPDGTGYATLAIDSHFETWPIRSKGFRRWLARAYFIKTSSAPNSEAIQSALNVIEARAHFDGVERTVYVRVGAHNGRLYLDFADKRWRAVEIDADGWRIVDRAPIPFRRAAGMLALPEPVHGGSINELRPFLNIKEDKDFVLTVSFACAALRERGPYPVLVLLGPHGSCKSTFMRILRQLVDPNSAPLRALPHEDRDLYIAANNARLLAFDNVSWLPNWMSDNLCRLSTGGGFATRELYTDMDETLFDAMRPAILNAIEDIVIRSDLADRSIFLNFEEIPDHKRKAEVKFWAEFERAHPRILGALLDGIAHGLQQLPNTTLTAMPRMADFALWATACETAFWDAGTFAKAYGQNRDEAVDIVIEADLVATAVQKFITELTKAEWEGTSSDLLAALKNVAGEDQTKLKEWPQTPRALSSRLRLAAPMLRKAGTEITFDRDKRTRKIAIRAGDANHPGVTQR